MGAGEEAARRALADGGGLTAAALAHTSSTLTSDSWYRARPLKFQGASL